MTMSVSYGVALLFIVVPLLSAQYPGTLQCRHCNGESSLNNCYRREICGYGQKCFVRQVEADGSLQYYAGCVDDYLCYGSNYTPINNHGGRTLCHKCCADHYACSLSDLCPETQSTFQCLHCNGQSSLSSCHQHFTCGYGQKCFVRKVEVNGSLQYYAGCSVYCDGRNYTPINDRGGTTLCHRCCPRFASCEVSDLCPEATTTSTTTTTAITTISPTEISCFKCDGEKSLSHCYRSSCGFGQNTCFVRQEEFADGVKYFAGCTSDQFCQGDQYTAVDLHGGNQLCSRCCTNHTHCSLSDLCPPAPRTCLSCKGEGSIANCISRQLCFEEEKCFVNQEEYRGQISYYAGCTYEGNCHGTTYQLNNHHGGVTLCGKCCPNHSQCSLSDLCPPSRCLSCNGEGSISDCSNYQFCTPEQRCYVNQVQLGDQVKYYSGCSDAMQCQSSVYVPLTNHGGIELCAKCCEDPANCSLSALCPLVAPLVKCLTCEGEHVLARCTKYTTCAHGQKCFVNQVDELGKVRYYAGCADQQECNNNSYSGPSHGGTQLCAKCCTDSANCSLSGLCPPEPQRCLSCNGEESIAECKNYSQCIDAEKCYLKQIEIGGRITYYSGCTSEFFCLGTQYTGVDHHGGTQLCAECCPTQSNCSLEHLCHPSPVECLSCNGEESLTNCTQHTNCSYGQKCYVDQVQEGDTVRYYAGCRSEQLCQGTSTSTPTPLGRRLCSKCCAGHSRCSLSDLCPPVLKCVKCIGETSVANCTSRETCTDRQKCYVIQEEADGKIKYYSGCTSENQCQGINYAPVSNHDGILRCAKCCMDHTPCSLSFLCAPIQTTVPTATILTTKTTPTTTTTTLATTTIPTTPVHSTTAATSKTKTTSAPSTTNPTTAANTTLVGVVITVPTATITYSTSPTARVRATTTKKPLTTAKHHASGHHPVKCEVCDGPLCGMITTDPVGCPHNTPYCMNIVENTEIGDRIYTKKCANHNECQRRWWEGSSDQPNCVNFKVGDSYYFRFTCVYCCTKDGCNTDIFPARSSLFKGSS